MLKRSTNSDKSHKANNKEEKRISIYPDFFFLSRAKFQEIVLNSALTEKVFRSVAEWMATVGGSGWLVWKLEIEFFVFNHTPGRKYLKMFANLSARYIIGNSINSQML